MTALREGRAWCVVGPRQTLLARGRLYPTERGAWNCAAVMERLRDYEPGAGLPPIVSRAALRAAGWRVVRVRIVAEEASDE